MRRISRRTAIRQSGAVALLASSSVEAWAQGAAAWPSKPITIIVNYGPGGGSDNMTRPFADRLSKVLGQQVIIENRGGASGAIGVEAMIKSPPDGYTFLATPSLTVVILPHLRKLTFDPLKDLVPVTNFGEGALLFTMHPSVPANSIPELVAYAKANPGKLSWGTPGVGSYGHLVCETFKQQAGVDILHVPYRSTGDLMPDFLSGVVQFQIDPVSLPHVAAGKAKLLAVFGRNRRPDYPNVPMMKEIYPELDYIVWFGIFAPLGTPELIVSRMSQEMNKIAGDAELKLHLHNLALTPHPGTPAEAAALLKSDFERYGKIIKEFNIRAE
jgi:tripartite-type tricarboxylate transporter receptor subunit TctC